MKNTKKISMLLVTAMLACTALSGCGGEKTTNENMSTEASGVTKITEKPLELSIFMLEGKPYNDDWEIFRQAEQWTNVGLRGTLAQSVTDKTQAFNMMMASGDVADIVVYWKENFNKYGKQGAFLELTDLINKYAPNIKKYLEEHEDVKKAISDIDGNIYYIPYVADGDTAKTWFIRTDWLEKLGLEIPNTVDEYYNVLKSFRNGDPNGNGQADEIPYFNRDVGSSYEESISDMLMLWHARKGIFEEDGKIKFGPLEPEYKTAISNIARWYAEGLIDQQIYTRKNARDTLLANNTGGSTHDWCGSTAEFNTTVSKTVDGFKFEVMAPPGGVEYSRRESVSKTGWGISVKNKNPVETIKYFDFWFTEEGKRLFNFGIEGEDYTMVDGKPVFTEQVLNNGMSVADYLKQKGSQLSRGALQDFEYEKQWLNDIALAGVDLYVNGGYLAPQPPMFLRTDDEEKRNSILSADITTFVREQTQKWVMGMESVETGYDNFVKQLKEMGVDELIEINQSARDRFNNLK